MSVPSISWSELSPSGGDNISLGDNRIREAKTQIRQVIDVDHDFPSSGQADDVGQHKRMTLQEQADLGTGDEGVCILGAQTTDDGDGGTKPELIYTDEDDNDIQLTKNGEFYPGSAPTLAHWSAVMNLVYPVGSVVTLGVSTNPATLFGIGTWTAIAGKVIVGIDATQTEFDTLNETGGAKTVTLDITQIPSHSHEYSYGDIDGSGTNYVDNNATNNLGKKSVDAIGGGLAHENMPPYIVKYVWERVS